MTILHDQQVGDKAGRGIQIIALLGNGVANVLHLIGRKPDICPGDVLLCRCPGQIPECLCARLCSALSCWAASSFDQPGAW